MTTQYYEKPKEISAFEARFEAIKLSFAPVAFQAAYALYQLGILHYVEKQGEMGALPEDIAQALDISLYGVKVLLDMGLSSHLVWLNEDRYVLDKTGYFLLTDKMVQVNFDFIQHSCYQGLYSLLESVKTGKPEGLKIFGNSETIYPLLSTLPEKAKESWFAFDHFYSDNAFKEAFARIFSKPVKTLLDIGGNTGKWALYCFEQDSQVEVTIADLPPQLHLARNVIEEKGFSHRFHEHPLDILDLKSQLPKHHEVIWVSQFLDCFSEEQIKNILKKISAVMDENTKLYILETFWDRQAYEPAAFSVNATSLYFTAMANGNSRMYHSKDLMACLTQADLRVISSEDGLGMGHTLLCCEKITNV